jgi:hypothetical protein
MHCVLRTQCDLGSPGKLGSEGLVKTCMPVLAVWLVAAGAYGTQLLDDGCAARVGAKPARARCREGQWCGPAARVLRCAVARLRGGAYRDDDDYSDDVMVHGGDGPVHDCGAHAWPPCRASDGLLWSAAFAGDVEGVRQALHNGADPNAPNPYDSDRAALHYVVSSRNTSCPRCAWTFPDCDPACRCRQQLISELVRAGADAARPCALGARAVHLAAATGAIAAVKVLTESGVDVCATDSARRGPLHYAAVSVVCVPCCVRAAAACP